MARGVWVWEQLQQFYVHADWFRVTYESDLKKLDFCVKEYLCQLSKKKFLKNIQSRNVNKA